MGASHRIVLMMVVLSLRAQTPLPPDLAALTKIRQRMIFNLDHQPNYTCVETIERSSRPKLNAKVKIIDTLRLEVALVDGRELFAWPGSRKFEEADVSKIITSGAIGNGNFGTHAKTLFTTQVPTFHYVGEEDFQGKRAIHFEYKVTQMFSGYSVTYAGSSATVGYHGSFYANPDTFDTERIEVIADDIPPWIMLASVEDKIDYAVAHIGDRDFLLPAESELTMLGTAGTEDRNHVKFSACREFSGESVLSFGEAPSSKTETAAAAREFDLPVGLDLELVLTKDIDLRTAAIGDAVYTRLNRDVHDPKDKKQIVLPKGATATGRIARVEKEAAFSIIGIEFPEIEAPGILAHMKGDLTRTVGILRLRENGSAEAVGGKGRVNRSEEALPGLQTPQHLGEGVLWINPTVRILTHGCILFWRT